MPKCERYCNIRPVRQEFSVVRLQITTTDSIFSKSIQSVFNDTGRASVKSTYESKDEGAQHSRFKSSTS